MLRLHELATRLSEQTSLPFEAVVLSNGLGLSNEHIDSLLARGMRLAVSLDGLGHFHDAQRPTRNGKASFLQLVATLDRLQARHLTPLINITLTNLNLGGLEQLTDFLLDRSLPFTYNFYRPNRRALRTDLELQPDATIAALHRAYERIAQCPPRHSLLAGLCDRARLDIPQHRPCGMGRAYLAFDAGAAVAPCHMLLDGAAYPFGQRTSDRDRDAEFLLKTLHDALGRNPPVDERSACRGCVWQTACAGGCPIFSGPSEAASPYCATYRAALPEILRLEAARLLHG